MTMNNKRFFSILLTLALLLGMMSGMSLTAYAASDPEIVVGGTRVELGNDGSGYGWSYTSSTHTLKLRGVSILSSNSGIASGAVGYGIRFYKSYPLTIILENANTVDLSNYGDKSIGIYSAGSIIITGTGSLTAKGYNYGIYSGFNITIDGGTVEAVGDLTACIYSVDNITINGGAVTACGIAQSGIGSKDGKVTITDGNVNAKGSNYGISALNGTVSISGGTVAAKATNSNSSYGINSSSVKISGGKVTAEGKHYGIRALYNTTIEGGTVKATATADSSSGIFTKLGYVTISGGSVTATGAYSGINASGAVAISKGTLTATGGYGIKGDSTTEITGGTVTATGNEYNGILCNGEMKIGSGIVAVTASGNSSAIDANAGSGIYNAIIGTGWTDMAGTKDKAEIPVSTGSSQTPVSNYKKVQFPEVLDPAVVTTKPAANTLTYNGKAQALVTAGAAKYGAMNYALGTDATTEPTSGWDTSIPSGTDAGTWYVWYKAATTDKKHKDSKPDCVTVSIQQEKAKVTAKDQTINEGGAIAIGVDQAVLSGAVKGHVLSAVTLTASGTTSGTITPSAAKIADADGKDVTKNYDIEFVKGALTVKAAISAKVTFKVVNGAWDDGTTADVTVTLSGYEGDTLKLAQSDIPAVGTKPADTYKAGAWDTTPSTDTSFANGSSTTYTYTYAKKDAISAKVTFKVVNGSWDDGSAKDMTVTLSGYEGDTLKLAQSDIPSVGNKPADTCKAGAWDTTPSTDTSFANGSSTTYTYTYAKKDAISAKVTFKVVNGSWDDGTKEDVTVTLSGYEGDTLKLAAAQIPAVGNRPDENYKAGIWDVTPSTETVIAQDTTYTYTYLQEGAISATVTFKVVNGSWDDGTIADKTVTLTGNEGDTLKLAAAQIPAVGNKPNDTYKAGIWDVTPSVETAITGNTTYTYTYARKALATVTKAPKAKKPTYNGKAQKLVTAGTAEGGTMAYAVTKTTKAPKASAYAGKIPTAAKAGTYYVWYKAVGDADHRDSKAARVKVIVYRRGIGDCKITVKDQSYTGKALKPKVTVKYGKTVLKEGKDYSLNYSKKLVDPGKYEVKVTGLGNFKNSKKLSFMVNLPKIKISSLTSEKTKIKVKWSQKAAIKHCQIQVSQKKNFSSYLSMKYTISEKVESHAKTVKGLQEGTKYYVRIRTYKTVGKKTYYSAWSEVESVRTKSSTKKNAQVRPVEMTVGEVLDLNELLTQEEIETVKSWSTVDAEIAAVSPEGVVTAIQPGEAAVLAILENDEEIEFAITVKADGIILFDISEDDLTLDLDEDALGDALGDVEMNFEIGEVGN